MIEDARTLPDGSLVQADLCIVGGGGAGITLARSFAGTQRSVLLIESGGFDFEERTQSLYAGEASRGLYDLDISRLRYFGGSTNHWGGVCRPLDEDDFAHRPWVPYSGWPITRAELNPYYVQACDIVQLDRKTWDNASWWDLLPRLFREPFMGKRIDGAVFQVSPPTHFGDTYRPDLKQAANVRTLLNANLVDISANPAASHVSGLTFKCFGGPSFTVKAGTYVLATGPVETARLLLAANSVQPAGLGNGHDVLGRYYCNHPGFYAADIVLSTPESAMVKPIASMQRIIPRLIVRPETAAQERIGKFSAWVRGVDFDGNIDLSPGYIALRSIFRDVRHMEFRSDLAENLMRVLGDVDGVAKDIWARFRATPVIRLDPEWEQTPNPDSRVTLIGERDPFGMPRVRVDWRLSELDVHTCRRSLEIIGEVVGEAGFGRLRLHEWIDQPSPDPAAFPGHENYHAAGTTRMSDDPRTGIVDRNCRMHAIDNLYVVGGSVFPTIGAVNPTLTVVALTLRLADHLKAINA